HRHLDEITVGVRENGELPPASPSVFERRSHLGKRLPRRERERQPILLTGRRAELAHRRGHHLAVRALAAYLKSRLDLVIALELLVRLVLAEDARQLPADAA